MLKINAQFITSAANKSQFLQSDKPQIAVCGKSNVGKSSFINMLAGQKKLAKVSKEPGRTRLVNYFDFGDFVLADLPGYGYAKVSKAEKDRWAKLMDDFFAESGHISHVFLLVDGRHEPTANDLTMVNYLYSNAMPFTVVSTKADKLSRAAIARNSALIAAALKCGAGDIIPTSSETRFGLDKILSVLDGVVRR